MTSLSGTSSELSRHLVDRILSGDLAAGAKLPSERTLAEDFGVSRPVVREVLRELSARKLIEVAPGRGAFVRPVQLIDGAVSLNVMWRRQQVTPRDVVRARKMLECEAAALAAHHATAADGQRMTNALHRISDASNAIDRAFADLAFHLAVSRASRNPVLQTMLAAVAVPTIELMLRSMSDPKLAEESHGLHRTVLDAIVSGEPERARTAMAEHLEAGEHVYADDYDKPLDPVGSPIVQRLSLSLETLLDDVVKVDQD